MYDMDHSIEYARLVKERQPLALASLGRWLSEAEAARLRELDERLGDIEYKRMTQGLVRIALTAEAVERAEKYLNVLKRVLATTGAYQSKEKK